MGQVIGDIKFESDLPQWKIVLEKMKQISGLDIEADATPVYSNARLPELNTNPGKICQYIIFRYRNFKNVFCFFNFGNNIATIEMPHHPPYYLETLLFAAFEDLGGEIGFELPSWARMKWNEKKWWQRIPH